MIKSFISVQRVSKNYGEIKALSRISFSIQKGEFVCLVGPSGAGKTTLIRLLTCEEKPTFGRILVDSCDIHLLPRREIPFYRRKIGVVFQDFKLLHTKTVYENVAYALEVAGAPTETIKKRTDEVLGSVGLSEKKDNYPNELSGGEKQRASLARALVHRPSMIIADEPTGNLDPATSWEIITLLFQINKKGTTILLATHNREIVNALKKRVLGLKGGHLIYDKKVGQYIL